MKRLLSIIVAVAVILATLTLGVTAASKDSYSIVKRDGKWICVDKKGNFNKNANGIYQNSNGWWKTSNGVVTFKETGVFQNENGWWRVVNSKVDFKANGIYQNQNGWWKTTNGKVTFKDNGVFQNENGWWRVEHSKVDFKANSIYQNQNGWWKTTNGKVTFKETGVFKNEFGSWYVENSRVEFNKNGKVDYNNNNYQITNGKAEPIGLETAIISFNANGTDVNNLPDSITVTINERVVEPPAPLRDGYYFVGWFTDEDTTEKYDFSMPVLNSIMLYAKWRLSTDNLNDDIIDRGDIEILSEEGIIDVEYDEKGRPVAIDGEFSDNTILSKEDASDVLNSANSLFGNGFFCSTSDISLQTIEDNTEKMESFYRFSPSINGIPVLGSQIIISTDNNGKITGLLNSYDSRIENINTNSVISIKEAESIAVNQMINDETVNNFLGEIEKRSSQDYDEIVEQFKSELNITTELIILALGEEKEPELVYAVTISCSAYLEQGNDEANYLLDIKNTYFVSATDSSGSIIDSICNDENVTLNANDSSGRLRYFEATKIGDTYEMKDTNRNIETYKARLKLSIPLYHEFPGEIVTTNINRPVSPDAVSAHANMSVVYDYYLNHLGRWSYDNNGAKIISSIVSFDNNASWKRELQQFVFYGKSSRCLDVCGHEFTHAVINHVVGNGKMITLNYKGESGALNESYADIMGCLIEGKTGKDKWLFGEDSKTYRNLADPSEYGQPEHYKDRKFGVINYSGFTGPNNDDGVHYNSGIFNFAAYKMMTDSRTKTVSDETWARVFYNSLFRLTTTANFFQARCAVIYAARNAGFNNTQLNAIKEAFDAVGITEKNSIRINLTWGEKPNDLDSHLIGPFFDNENNYHISFSEDRAFSADGSTILAELDYDDTTSYGPEIITIYDCNPGTYYYYVHDFSNASSESSTEMSTSAAKVKVYDNKTLKHSFVIDKNSTGTYWDVFKMTIASDGTISIIPVNKYGTSSSFPI